MNDPVILDYFLLCEKLGHSEDSEEKMRAYMKTIKYDQPPVRDSTNIEQHTRLLVDYMNGTQIRYREHGSDSWSIVVPYGGPTDLYRLSRVDLFEFQRMSSE